MAIQELRGLSDLLELWVLKEPLVILVLRVLVDKMVHQGNPEP